MKKIYLALIAAFVATSAAFAQISFDPELNWPKVPVLIHEKVVVPPSPLKFQVLFIGGTDIVETTATYGNPAGKAPAKQWHDFIGFTPDTAKGTQDLGWISVNHEMIIQNDKIGDGGGMTTFKVRRNAETQLLEVVEQTLKDGRQGKFFNVDFINTVGSTYANCGGITSTVDGRIWTAEEWFYRSNREVRAASSDGTGFRDTTDFTIKTDIPGDINGAKIKAYQNRNYMVEIDPRQAVAIRKQYNWGRQGFEGGAILPDNRTVITGEDNTPGHITKFVADVAGDFTKGKTYVYKHDAPTKWIEIDNTKLDNMLNFNKVANSLGATMFDRLEWVVYNAADSNVYITETGVDNLGPAFANGEKTGGVYAPHHLARAAALGVDPRTTNYKDYYGRVLKLDMKANEVTAYLEGGPADASLYNKDIAYAKYPKHFTNPDGLNVLTVNKGTPKERTYMVICEDLNGTSFGRMPRGISNSTCELFLLDMSIKNPTVKDLVTITAVPLGAEITGACPTPDGKTLLVNSQHPSTANPFPYNNSLTFAITGWSEISTKNGVIEGQKAEGFGINVDPINRSVSFSEATDLAVYNAAGKRVMVEYNTNRINVESLATGEYTLINKDGATRTLVIE